MTKTKAKTRPANSDLFARIVASDSQEDVLKEYRFHSTRLWRFDYAIPQLKIAIEIDGGVWIQGRHNSPKGYIADLEKFNEAAALGWVVLKFTPQQQYTRQAFDVISRAVNYAKHLQQPGLGRHTVLKAARIQ